MCPIPWVGSAGERGATGGGATEDGSGLEKDKRSEIYIPNKERDNLDLDGRPGSSHPDLTWQDNRTDKDDPAFRAHANTATMKKRIPESGEPEPTAREGRSFERLVANVGEDFANLLPKLRPGMDEDEYRRDVREKCREIFGKWLGQHRKDGGDGEEETSVP